MTKPEIRRYLFKLYTMAYTDVEKEIIESFKTWPFDDVLLEIEELEQLLGVMPHDLERETEARSSEHEKEIRNKKRDQSSTWIFEYLERVMETDLLEECHL